jgi:penicillin-binding protein 2
MTSRLRLGVVGLVVLSLFGALLARLWYLQVLAAPTFRVAAAANGVRLVYDEAPRGRILDRTGRVLVDNRVSEAITLSRSEAKRHPEVINRLAVLLGISDADVQGRIADPRFTPYKPVPIAVDVDKAKLVYIREHQEDFPGVEVTQLPERAYPYGTLAAHLVGYAGQINDAELAERRAKGYRLGDTIGKSGVEQIYEADLRGQPGLSKLEVDARGRVLRSLGTRAPVQGNDLQLTVDLDVQRLAEESLAQGLDVAHHTYDRDSKKTFTAPAGAVVVMDPRDGSLLALASNPSYDPSAFVNGIRPQAFAALQDPAGHLPLNDRAIQGQYAPGSTFKLATAVAALEKGLVAPSTTYNDTGVFHLSNCVGKCTFRNALGQAHGRVALPRALTVSSDFYFYTLGAAFWGARGSVGESAVQDVARSLSLGERTGVALPGEAKGVIPDPETRKRRHDANPKAFPEAHWFIGDNVNMAIGQGEVSITPLQLANAYASFANGGTVFQPRVAGRVATQSGAVIRDLAPVVNRRVDLPPAVRDPIMAGLRGVPSDPQGTARAAFLTFDLGAFPVAGKTGTAQVVGSQDTALFVAMAPADSPRYVVAVVMEESGFGGEAAAPVARRILQGLAGQRLDPVTRGGGVD